MYIHVQYIFEAAMGRKSKFDRGAALDWVMHEIWLHGYEGVSVKYIAENLSITRSSFYHTFTSKEALFKEVLDYYLLPSPCFTKNLSVESEDPLLSLTQFFCQVCQYRIEDPVLRGCMLVNSVVGLVGVHPTLGPIVAQKVEAGRVWFESLIKLSVSRGDLDSATDATQVALSLQTLLIGLNTMSKVMRDEGQLWDIAKVTLKGLNVFKQTVHHTASINS
jgi:TetR/AcrR family transcriptional repressor of nem operon